MEVGSFGLFGGSIYALFGDHVVFVDPPIIGATVFVGKDTVHVGDIESFVNGSDAGTAMVDE